MSQIPMITSTLKQLLKQHKLTYKEVANALDMSEANVKRVFASEQFSLQRLEQICDLMQLSLADLFALGEQKQSLISQLTQAQEQELMEKPKLFLVAVCVRDGWQFEDIISHYQVDELECIRLLARLDSLNMIQLLPNNRYKSLVAQDFRWIPGGPLERFIEQQVLTKFLQGNFNRQDSFRFYLRGSYSDATISLVRRRLEQLTKEVAQLNQQDARLPLDKRQSVGLFLAMRPWQLGLFNDLRREDAQ
ncbi:helix-turn-helix transcriptional regulator [Pseudoalteromonas rubra]|uniref:helix-turn-helix domain-containing protein n=1 Tax=Pseudoalteromonas rubra TaxID=43658 RepID=UPI002DBDBEC2|nr:helix-turn-helix transcriptional regulator [Pseudoalteromonas rubra]MEC4090772.1 helix-turn-helix transcriptional regulator [Pseudoalteromonas rubra]